MKNNCIVLADKHQNILEGLRGLLETLFGGVLMVADLPSLNEALNKIKPRFAIVDLSLLSQGHLNTATELNKRFPDVKIIILSDYDEPEVIKEIMAAGTSGFILKRCAGTDLLSAIENIKEGKTFISPAVDSEANGIL